MAMEYSAVKRTTLNRECHIEVLFSLFIVKCSIFLCIFEQYRIIQAE